MFPSVCFRKKSLSYLLLPTFFVEKLKLTDAGNFWGQTRYTSCKLLDLAVSRTCLVWETLSERSFFLRCILFKMYHLKQSFFFSRNCFGTFQNYSQKFPKGWKKTVKCFHRNFRSFKNF